MQILSYLVLLTLTAYSQRELRGGKVTTSAGESGSGAVCGEVVCT
jgi:hypothetical protein